MHLFSLWVDAWASLMRHTEQRGDSDVRRGTFKKLLLVLAVSMAIGLGVSVASAATRCNPVLTPGEGLARVAANCPPPPPSPSRTAPTSSRVQSTPIVEIPSRGSTPTGLARK